MTATILIPARYASTRLPGKPLLAETGKCLIQHVVEGVCGAACAGRVVVATDDERIRRAVVGFGGEAVMTSATCATGTDRLAEAAKLLGLDDDEIVINVQGDEPEIPPALIDQLARLLADGNAPMATLATRLDPSRREGFVDRDTSILPARGEVTLPSESPDSRPRWPRESPTECPRHDGKPSPQPASSQAADPNRVKVVLNAAGQAMYFSRCPIPYDRDASGTDYLLHVGTYAYRAGFLRTFAALSPTPAEQAEKLEQLRALEHGFPIAVAVVDYDGEGIDTPADYETFVRRVRSEG